MRNNPQRNSLIIAFFLAAMVPLLVWAYSSGPPDAHTGGFGEPTCIECHGTRVNSNGGNVTINGLPPSYSSGETYPITVTITDSTARRWGFELSARGLDVKQAGNLAPTDGNTQIATARTSGGFLQNPSIQYIEHTLAGTRRGSAGPVSFSFNWTAPDTSRGTVVFDVAANAANNNDTNDSGDHIYQTEMRLEPQAAGPMPVVNAGGTVNNASFAAGSNALAPGTIAAIFGSNLNDGSSNAFSSFGSDGKLLATLGGASVTINGFAAPIFSSFPTQLNIQIPTDLSGVTTGTVVVTVGGQASAPQTVPLGPFSPGIFSTSQNGAGQGAVQIANTTIFAAPANSISGVQTRPAVRGVDFITIYCTGLGNVSNGPATGAPASGDPVPTTTTVPQLTIGGIAATVTFSGLSPGFVGLYQVNAQVPASTPIGDAVPVVLNLSGTPSNTITIAVSGP